MIEKQIANKIHLIRKANKISINKLAQRTKLSKALLSRVENCKVSPTIKTLYKIAKGLDVTLSAFLDEEQLPPAPISIVKKSDRKEVVSPRRAFGPYKYSALSSLSSPKIMEPFSVMLYADSEKIPELVGHVEEEIIIVISGRIKFTYGGEEHILYPGDALHFAGEVPHKAAVVGKSVAEVVSIIASPF
jgi:XRE family transcriptional regulator, regulator of sulfur utilization